MSDESKVTEAHPAAELFPLMPTDELQKLADDIKQNGLLEPIVLLGGRVLDGRNRLKACVMAGVAPHYTAANLNGHSPTLYVVSKNLHRRHLTPGQCAAIGVDMMPMLHAEAKERIIRGGQKGGQESGRTRRATKGVSDLTPPSLANVDNDLRGRSRAIAARAVNASETMIHYAAQVKKQDPELFDRIRRGEVNVNEALRTTAEAQPKPKPAPFPRAGKRWASLQKAETARMVNGLSQIGGLCRGLSEVKMQLLVLTASDRTTWAMTAIKAARILHRFAKKVRQP